MNQAAAAPPEPWLHLSRSACLNARHTAATCARCVVACPLGALHLAGRLPEVDAERCTRCGLCVSYCPTEALAEPVGPERHLPQVVAAVGEPTVALCCPLHPSPEQNALPVEEIIRHRRCLGTLSVSLLLELSDGGRRTVWLDDDPCEGCALQTGALLRERVETANRLLSAFGREPALHHAQALPLAQRRRPRRYTVIPGDQPRLSRRAFLQTLGVRGATQQTIDQPPTTRGRNTLPQGIPAPRQHLLQQLASLGGQAAPSVATVALPFANLAVEEASCSACGLCARFCPTGALHFSTEEGNFHLSFQAAHCIGCDICVAACPEQALRQLSEIAPDALRTGSAQILLTGILDPCAGCGAPTRSGRLCHSCRQGTVPTTAQCDSAGLFADLHRQLGDAEIERFNDSSDPRKEFA